MHVTSPLSERMALDLQEQAGAMRKAAEEAMAEAQRVLDVASSIDRAADALVSKKPNGQNDEVKEAVIAYMTEAGGEVQPMVLAGHIEERLGVGRHIVTRAVSELVEEKRLRATGATSGRRYMLP